MEPQIKTHLPGSDGNRTRIGKMRANRKRPLDLIPAAFISKELAPQVGLRDRSNYRGYWRTSYLC